MDEQGSNETDELTLAPVTVISRQRPKALWGILAAVAVAAGALAVTSGGGEDAAAPPLPIALGGAEGAPAASAAADAKMAWVTYVAADDLPALGGEAPAYKLSGTADEAQVRALADALGLDGEVTHQDGTWTLTGADGAVLEVYEGGGAPWWFSAASPTTATGSDECVEMDADSGAVSRCASAGSIEDCVTPEGGIVGCATVTTLAPMPADECPATASCVELQAGPVDCTAVEAGDCPGAVEPPADLPSEDEARAIALDLLAATGVDSDDAVVTVDGPYDAWYVTVEPTVDGIPSGLQANVSVGSAGAIVSAGGYLGAVERLGDYPLLDTRAAIDRMNDQMADRGWYADAPGTASDVAVAGDDDSSAGCLSTTTGAVTTIPCPDDTGDTTTTVPATTVPPCKVQADGSEICEGSGSSGPAVCPELVPPMDQPLPEEPIEDCTLVDPVPVPLPEPEPTQIVLTGATGVLVLMPANDGSSDAYLVPGYRFTGADGVQVDAPAVGDASLAGPPATEPPVTGTFDTSIVPDPGGTDGGSTPPSGCEPLVEGDGSGTTHTIQPCAGLDPMISTAVVGAAYPVDVDLGCGEGAFSLGGRIWHVDEADWGTWSAALAPGEAFEGGTFTLTDEAHGTFVGDAAGTKQAGFHIVGQAEDLFCSPASRP